jgi:hypothetical protein
MGVMMLIVLGLFVFMCMTGGFPIFLEVMSGLLRVVSAIFGLFGGESRTERRAYERERGRQRARRGY